MFYKLKNNRTMIKKIILAASLVSMIAVSPAQAQFKNLGKIVEKAVDGAVDKVTKKATDMATDVALKTGANKASDQIIKFMDGNNTITSANDAHTTRLKSVLGNDFTKLDDKMLDIKVYETSEANIITLNNGSIRIYSGMMDMLSDDEIKALIAMQVGHIKSGNIRDNLLKAVSGDKLEDMTETQLDKLLSFSESKIKVIMNELLQLPYTREQNNTADNYAQKFLKNNGGKSNSYSSLTSKIRELSLIDLESKTIDRESEATLQAKAASSFINVNSLR